MSSRIAALIDQILNPPHKEEDTVACALYLYNISDDILEVLYRRVPEVDRETIKALWGDGLRLLMKELRDE